MKNNTTFKAPQKALKSSWIDMAYTKPKAGNVIKRSLGNRSNVIVKTIQGMTTLSSFSQSNQY